MEGNVDNSRRRPPDAETEAPARWWRSLRQGWQRKKWEHRLRRRLRAELSLLNLDFPASMDEVCQHLSRRRHKPIRLVSYPLEAPGPGGLWLSTPAAEYILYQAETTFLHQQHIVAHELGHVMSGHASDESDDAVWHELMPDIPPEVIRRALRRTAYHTEQEWEAETIATILLEAASVAELVHQPANSSRARRAQQALGDTQDWL